MSDATTNSETTELTFEPSGWDKFWLVLSGCVFVCLLLAAVAGIFSHISKETNGDNWYPKDKDGQVKSIKTSQINNWTGEIRIAISKSLAKKKGVNLQSVKKMIQNVYPQPIFVRDETDRKIVFGTFFDTSWMWPYLMNTDKGPHGLKKQGIFLGTYPSHQIVGIGEVEGKEFIRIYQVVYRGGGQTESLLLKNENGKWEFRKQTF